VVSPTRSDTALVEAPPGQVDPSRGIVDTGAMVDDEALAVRARPARPPVAEIPDHPVAPSGEAPTAARSPEGSRRLDRALTWVALVVTISGMLLVLFVGYLFAFTNLEGARNQRLLLQEFPAKGSGKEVAAGALAVLHGTTPTEGQPAALLQIPALGFSQVVVEGSSSADLEKGPGLMPGTARPGERGNAVIAGRRLTYGRPFEHLLSLVQGDRVILTGSYGTFTYRVVRTGIATSGQRDPVEPTRDAQVTLVTSSPLSDPGREYAVADLVGKPLSYPPYVITAPRTELALGGDPAAALPIALWGAALLLAVACTIVAYRRSRLTFSIYLLSTPILVALAIGCFENVARLLPAAF
jgi:LPXTG-site transpeptidase (sortase) family protein